MGEATQLLFAPHQAIVRTTLPTMVGEPGKPNNFSLVMPSYILTSTVATAMPVEHTSAARLIDAVRTRAAGAGGARRATRDARDATRGAPRPGRYFW
jgi:hypothetical protein